MPKCLQHPISAKNLLDHIADKKMISDLVPHKPPMLLIDRLIKTEKTRSTAEVFIRDDNLFLKEDKTVDEMIFPELIAQTALIHEAWQHPNHKAQAYLTAFRNIIINRCATSGELLIVGIKYISKLENLSWVEGTVYSVKEKLARGEVAVWIK
ncbi:MAG: hypothetical protein JW774_00620 [Candidatus Aureabacteria bacterium]|nr:hypothetical protein [Candidatus Auribacterota bacterium]